MSSTIDREVVLNQVARQINNMTESRNQSNIAASTAILAGLVLDKEVIRRVLRSDIMRESVIYQDILEEGKAEALLEVAINLFKTGMPLEQIATLTGLSIDQLQYLKVTESDDSK